MAGVNQPNNPNGGGAQPKTASPTGTALPASTATAATTAPAASAPPTGASSASQSIIDEADALIQELSTRSSVTASPRGATNSGGSEPANASVSPVAHTPPGAARAAQSANMDEIDELLHGLSTPSAAGSPPPAAAPVGANNSGGNAAVVTKAAPVASVSPGAPEASTSASVATPGPIIRPSQHRNPAFAASPAPAAAQGSGNPSSAPLAAPDRSGSPTPPARPVAASAQTGRWVQASPPRQRGGASSPERAGSPLNITGTPTAPVQGMRAVPLQPSGPAAATPAGSAAAAAPTPTPEISKLMRDMSVLDREAETLKNITGKWDESVKAELQKKNINIKECEENRVDLFSDLLKLKSGTPPAENSEIEAIVKRRDEAVLRGAPNNEIVAITKELTTKMGKNDNDPRIHDNLEARHEVLQKLKQAKDIESTHIMKLPGMGPVGADGKRKEEFNKADIALYQARLLEIEQQMAALKEQIKTAQDSPRTRASETRDELENPNPGDPRKKIEDVVKLIAQASDVNNCKKVSEGEYQLDFKTVPPAPINVSNNKVTAPKGADETTMRKQCQVFFDLMEKTGRKDFTLDDVKVSGADEKKLKAFLAEEFANRYGTSISLNAKESSTPTPPIETPPTVTASIGGPRGMGGHRS